MQEHTDRRFQEARELQKAKPAIKKENSKAYMYTHAL
jgi:hypothetical protein